MLEILHKPAIVSGCILYHAEKGVQKERERREREREREGNIQKRHIFDKIIMFFDFCSQWLPVLQFHPSCIINRLTFLWIPRANLVSFP